MVLAPIPSHQLTVGLWLYKYVGGKAVEVAGSHPPLLLTDLEVTTSSLLTQF